MAQPINLFEKALYELRLMQKNTDFSKFFRNFGQPLFQIQSTPLKFPNMDISKQLKSFTKNLTASFSKWNKKPAEDNYPDIIQGFLPPDARLITPRLPLNANHYRLSDIDGDSIKELIFSYRAKNETVISILKKQNSRWSLIGEIRDPHHQEIEYLGVADLVGDNRRQILIGSTGRETTPSMHGYDLYNGRMNKMFAREYDRFEVVSTAPTSGGITKKHLAFWRRNQLSSHDIELAHWNGENLETLNNSRHYYYNRVIPYYWRQVKLNSKNPSHWYAFADSLYRMGIRHEALQATEMGLRLTSSSPESEHLKELKNRLSKD